MFDKLPDVFRQSTTGSYYKGERMKADNFKEVNGNHRNVIETLNIF